MNTIQLPVQITTQHLLTPRLDVYVPIAQGLENAYAQQKINSELLNLTNQLIKDQGFYDNPMTEITGGYELKTNQRSILSLSIINYAFSGGAHGLTIIKSLTFDINTAKEYALMDLFKSNSDYVKVLSDIIQK